MAKRQWIRLALLAALLTMTSVPAMAQETITGFFEGPVGDANAATGAVALTGWAVADSGIAYVTIQVDGKDVGQTIYGQPRPDVEAKFPGFPDSAGAGFSFMLNTTDFTNGLHVITATARTFDGNDQVIPNSVEVFFNNNTSILTPFGEIEFPQRNADLFGTCDLTDPNRIYTTISGWALDLGVEIGDAGVGYVELLLDGVIVANDVVSCGFDFETGGLTNCYGLPRLDVERQYPFANNAPNAGYRFVLDIGAILNSGWTQGHHVLTVRSGDIDKQVANIDEIPVNFFCEENNLNEGSIGLIETPRPGRIAAGDTLIQGWAVDIDGITGVRVYVDGVEVGAADYGVDSRPRVQIEYPGYPDAGAPVWRLIWDSTTVSDGGHQVQARAHDERAHVTVIGERTFFVDNDQPDFE